MKPETHYDPITGVVTIDGKEYTDSKRVRINHYRIRTTTVVIDWLLENKHFGDRVAAGKAVTNATSLKLEDILAVGITAAVAKTTKTKSLLALEYDNGEWVVRGLGPKKSWKCQKMAMIELIHRARINGFGDVYTVR